MPSLSDTSDHVQIPPSFTTILGLFLSSCRSFRNGSHQDFVRGVCWLPGVSDSLTTVGWDHQVIHHTVGQAAPATGSSAPPP